MNNVERHNNAIRKKLLKKTTTVYISDKTTSLDLEHIAVHTQNLEIKATFPFFFLLLCKAKTEGDMKQCK